MRSAIFLIVPILLTSCLKKIDSADGLNTNLFDPDYAGDQWFVLEDVTSFTDGNNDPKISFDITVPEENVPSLKPPSIKVAATVNQDNVYYFPINVHYKGHYETQLIIDKIPSTTNYCLELGVFVEEDSLVINKFEECRDI